MAGNYRHIYIETIEQILLMNLVARELWHTDESFKHNMQEIRKLNYVFTSKENFTHEFGNETYHDLSRTLKDAYISNYEARSDYKERILTIQEVKENISKPWENNIHSHQNIFTEGVNAPLKRYKVWEIGNDPASKRIKEVKEKQIFNLLRMFFETLDSGRNSLPEAKIGSHSINDLYLNFLPRLKIPTKKAGYSYENLYLSLYHFDAVLTEIKITEKEIKELDNSSLEQVLACSQLANSMYMCNFKNNISTKSSINIKDAKNAPITQLIAKYIKLGLYKEPYEKACKSNNDEKKVYAEEIGALVKDALIEHLLKDTGTNELAKYDYKTFKKLMKENGKIGLVKRIDGIEALCYALLAYDYIEEIRGNKSEVGESLLKAITETKINHYLGKGMTNFPEEGVKKQLRKILREIKKGRYTNMYIDLRENSLKVMTRTLIYPTFC
ncbi:MAG: hypothetical protein OCC45_08550 [Desulfotalea sp.]